MRSLISSFVPPVLPASPIRSYFCSSRYHLAQDAFFAVRSSHRGRSNTLESLLSVGPQLLSSGGRNAVASLGQRQPYRAISRWHPSAAVHRVSLLDAHPLHMHHRRQSAPRTLLNSPKSDAPALRSKVSSSDARDNNSVRKMSAVGYYVQSSGGEALDVSGNERDACDYFEGGPRTPSSSTAPDTQLLPWPATFGPDTGITLAETLRQATEWLQKHDVVDPEPSASELLAKAAGFDSPQDMLTKWPAASSSAAAAGLTNAAEWDELRRLCGLRAAQHVPVQYLVGEWDFHRLLLEMRPPTLIPRPETEELVDMVLKWLRRDVIDSSDGTGGGSESLRFLDVGSGTGAIGLALLNDLPGASCVAIDAQQTAVQLSRRNAERTGLQDWYSCFHTDIASFGTTTPDVCTAKGTDYGFGGGSEAARGVDAGEGGFDGCFDFIVSNPPYIPRRDMEALPRDVADHEDSVALGGGEDGLDVVREIVQRCPRLLRKGGPRQLWMEVDTSHPEAMQRWFGGEGGVGGDLAGVVQFEWMRDMSQRPRFVRLTFAEEGVDGMEQGSL